jgi:hypothetical protein
MLLLRLAQHEKAPHSPVFHVGEKYPATTTRLYFGTRLHRFGMLPLNWKFERSAQARVPSFSDSGELTRNATGRFVTLDTYSHVLPTMQQAATDKLERMIYGT